MVKKYHGFLGKEYTKYRGWWIYKNREHEWHGGKGGHWISTTTQKDLKRRIDDEEAHYRIERRMMSKVV